MVYQRSKPLQIVFINSLKVYQMVYPNLKRRTHARTAVPGGVRQYDFGLGVFPKKPLEFFKPIWSPWAL